MVSNLNSISPKQYAVFREARAIVKQEFSRKLSLSDEWLEDLHTYVALSKNERLAQLYNTVNHQ